MTPVEAFARRLAAEIEHELERLVELQDELATAPQFLAWMIGEQASR